jgi:hypothetical protein
LKKWNVWIIASAAVVVAASAGGVALWNYHEQPEFCAVCHVMEPYLQSWESPSSPALMAHEHALEGVACLDCHEPTLEQQVDELIAYMKNDFETPLTRRNFPMDTCFNCHLPNEHTSYQEIANRTEDYEIDGELINPHDTHLDREECYRCHRMHRESLGINYCYSCHHERTLADDCMESGCHGQ